MVVAELNACIDFDERQQELAEDRETASVGQIAGRLELALGEASSWTYELDGGVGRQMS